MAFSVQFLADTWWYAATSRMSVAQVQQLAKQRAAQGFTAIQLVAAYPPEVAINSEHAANSGGWPLTPEKQINRAYFAELDVKFIAITQAGLQPILYGTWGNHFEALGSERVHTLWHELIKRYKQFQPLWCLCGEVDLPAAAGMLHSFPFTTRFGPVLRRLATPLKQFIPTQQVSKRLAAWDKVGKFVRSHDPDTPILVHPHIAHTARELFPNSAWLSANSFQSGHHRDRLAWLHQKAVAAAADQDPCLNLEPWYEGVGGDFGAQLQRQAFWVSMLSGCLGYAYGAQGLWNMNQQGEAFLGHWGNTDWQTAAAAPGAAHVGKAAAWLRKNGWFGRFTPQLVPNTDPSVFLSQAVSAIAPDETHVTYHPTLTSATEHNATHNTVLHPETLTETTITSLNTPDCIILTRP